MYCVISVDRNTGGHALSNKIDEYLKEEELVGLDKVLRLQRITDGYIAARLGITSLAPLGFVVGLLAGYVFFN